GGARGERPDGLGGVDGWNQNAAGVGPVIDERQGAVEDPVAARGDGGDPRAERDRADDLAARHRRKQAIALLSGTGAPYGMQRGEVARGGQGHPRRAAAPPPGEQARRGGGA